MIYQKNLLRRLNRKKFNHSSANAGYLYFYTPNFTTKYMPFDSKEATETKGVVRHMGDTVYVLTGSYILNKKNNTGRSNYHRNILNNKQYIYTYDCLSLKMYDMDLNILGELDIEELNVRRVRCCKTHIMLVLRETIYLFTYDLQFISKFEGDDGFLCDTRFCVAKKIGEDVYEITIRNFDSIRKKKTVFKMGKLAGITEEFIIVRTTKRYNRDKTVTNGDWVRFHLL